MERRQALVIDKDAAFVNLLSETLAPYGFEIIATDDSRKGFVRLKTESPALLFLAVDLPDREGFSLCTRARRFKRGVPIVLSTATLPDGEMAIHERTKAHADAYLDKRDLDPTKLLRSLDRLVDLGPPEHFVSPSSADDGQAISEDASAAPISSDGTPSPGVDAIESEVRALLADLDEHAAPQAAEDEPLVIPEDIAKDVPTLRREVARLRRDLDATRRVVRASPTAADNMLLRDELEERDKELARLQGTIFERDRVLREAKTRLDGLARQISNDKNEKQLLAQTIEERQARIETTETMLALAEDELKELRLQTDEEIHRERESHLETRKDFERRLAELQVAFEETERHVAELQKYREELEQQVGELETARIEAIRDMEDSLARMREEQSAAAFDMELKFDNALTEKDRAHEAALAARLETADEEHRAQLAQREADFRAELDDAQSRHEKALAALRKIHTDMLAEKDRDLSSAQERATKLEHELAQNEEEIGEARKRIASLEETARTRNEELSERERAVAKLEERASALEKEKADLGKAHEEALEKLRHENAAIIEALQRERQEDVSAQREHERQMIEARKMEHQTTLQKTTAEIEELRAQSREREEVMRKRYEQRLSEIEGEKAEEIQRRASELDEAGARITQLEESLESTNRELAERDEVIADQRGTISSLQALVGDFSTAETGATVRPKLDDS
jgi:CheY-like chemotaxis protein